MKSGTMLKLVELLKRVTRISRGRAWHLYSEAPCATSLQVCFVGNELQKNYIKYLIFKEHGKQKDIGVQYFWRSKFCLSRPRMFDLVVIECASDSNLKQKDEPSWFVPLWLMSYVDIPIPKVKSSFRSDLRNIRNNGFDYSITDNLREINHFYNDMYLPYINIRHGESAIVMNPEELTKAVSDGKCQLLSVVEAGKPVAGALIDYRNSLPNLWSIGVLRGRSDLLHKSVTSACYHFSFLYLQSQGYRRVSLGFTRCFPDDGVFRFKLKFFPQYYKPSGKGFAIFPIRTSPVLDRLFQDNPFIHLEDDKPKLAQFITDSTGAVSARDTALKTFKGFGLTSVQIYLTSQLTPALICEKLFEKDDLHYRAQSRSSDTGKLQRDLGIHFLRHNLNVTDEKSLLLYGDSNSDPETIDTVRSAAESLGMSVYKHVLNSDLAIDNQCEELLELIRDHDFDLLCEFSGQYFYNTHVWREAHRRGLRTFSLGPISMQVFRNCVGKVDAERMQRLCEELEQRLQLASIIRIYDDAGSDLRIQMKRPLSHKLLSRARIQTPQYSRVFKSTGALGGVVSSSFLGGQVAFIGYRPSIEGNIIVDGYMSPPWSLGKLKCPITLTLKRGSITQITGEKEAETLDRWLPANNRQLEHICIGVNPGATMDGSLIEAERVFGVCNFGFGGHPHHTDAVISNPILEIDGQVIIQQGKIEGRERESLVSGQ